MCVCMGGGRVFEVGWRGRGGGGGVIFPMVPSKEGSGPGEAV